MIHPNDSPDMYETKLPFPTRPLLCCNDETVEEYVIPDEAREEVLAMLFPGEPVPALDDVLYDLHEGKTFIVRDYRVTWERGRNWLASPYYPSSGGTVIDWLPAEYDDGGGDEGEFPLDFDEEEGEGKTDIPPPF